MHGVLLCFVLLRAILAQEDLHRPEENVGVSDPDLFEGDMILTPAQRFAAMTGADVSKAGLGRASIRANLWPGAVLVYELDPAIARSPRAMNAINAAMNLWKTQTCVTFKKRTNERAYAYIHIGAGCTSYMGKTGAKQLVSLASGCWYTHTVSHELGHALGFYHEQSRPDRDNFVIINWNNIKRGLAFAFNKYPNSQIDSLGTPYDYGSVMHYEAYAFSTNRRPTITPKKSGGAWTITRAVRNGLLVVTAMIPSIRLTCYRTARKAAISVMETALTTTSGVQSGQTEASVRRTLHTCRGTVGRAVNYVELSVVIRRQERIPNDGNPSRRRLSCSS